MVSFKKSVPITKAQTVKTVVANIFWPSLGMKRFLKYVLLKIKRLKGSPYSLASGLATGIAISFTPLIGFHVLLTIFITYLSRGSIVSSLFGTLMGNPWTLPVIAAFDYRLGSWILDKNANNSSEAIVVDNVIVDFSDLGESFSRIITIIQDPFANPFIANVYFPAIVGSIPLVILAWSITYWLTYPMYKKIADLRKKRLQKHDHKD